MLALRHALCKRDSPNLLHAFGDKPKRRKRSRRTESLLFTALMISIPYEAIWRGEGLEKYPLLRDGYVCVE